MRSMYERERERPGRSGKMTIWGSTGHQQTNVNPLCHQLAKGQAVLPQVAQNGLTRLLHTAVRVKAPRGWSHHQSVLNLRHKHPQPPNLFVTTASAFYMFSKLKRLHTCACNHICLSSNLITYNNEALHSKTKVSVTKPICRLCCAET